MATPYPTKRRLPQSSTFTIPGQSPHHFPTNLSQITHTTLPQPTHSHLHQSWIQVQGPHTHHHQTTQEAPLATDTNSILQYPSKRLCSSTPSSTQIPTTHTVHLQTHPQTNIASGYKQMTVLLHTWVQQMIVLPTHTGSSADECATPHQGPADECAAHTHSEGVQQMYVLPTHTRSSADECAAPHQGTADECAAHTHKQGTHNKFNTLLHTRTQHMNVLPTFQPAYQTVNPPWVTVCVHTCLQGHQPNPDTLL